MEKIVTDNMERIAEICRKYYVKSLYVFGSAAGRGIDGNPFGPHSDIDLLVEYEDVVYTEDTPIGGFDFLYMIKEFENLFGRKVDLVSFRSLRNPILIKHINEQKQLVYGQAG